MLLNERIKLGFISPFSKFNLLNSKHGIVFLSFNKLQRRSNIEQNYIRMRQAYCNNQQHCMIHINIFVCIIGINYSKIESFTLMHTYKTCLNTNKHTLNII